jgi:hypothetical protein
MYFTLIVVVRQYPCNKLEYRGAIIYKSIMVKSVHLDYETVVDWLFCERCYCP